MKSSTILSVLLYLSVTISSSVASSHDCLADLQERPCLNDADRERIYFNSEIGRCLFADLNNCTTGPNSFTDLVSCESQCVCQLPPEPTPCRFPPPYPIERFFFNPLSSQCEVFPTKIGSCSANGNLFTDKSYCTTICLCSLPPDSGTGSLDITSFFFNTKSQRCEEFTYAGKGGNSNRFATKAKCTDRCLCGQPKLVGPCIADIPIDPRFFYNKLTNKCEKFIYGGCRGNSNNFQTLSECNDACND